MVPTILELLLSRVQAQGGAHLNPERNLMHIDRAKLPEMYAVGKDWTLSATNRWGPRELVCLKNFSDENMAIELCECKPRDCIAALSEVILHEEEDRAQRIAREMLLLNPRREETLRYYFGDRLTDALLET